MWSCIHPLYASGLIILPSFSFMVSRFWFLCWHERLFDFRASSRAEENTITGTTEHFVRKCRWWWKNDNVTVFKYTGSANNVSICVFVCMWDVRVPFGPFPGAGSAVLRVHISMIPPESPVRMSPLLRKAKHCTNLGFSYFCHKDTNKSNECKYRFYELCTCLCFGHQADLQN